MDVPTQLELRLYDQLDIASLLLVSLFFSFYCDPYFLKFLFRPPIVNFLFPVTHPHCNFRAACIFITTFDDHVIEILLFRHSFCHVVEHLCGHIVGATTSVMVYY